MHYMLYMQYEVTKFSLTVTGSKEKERRNGIRRTKITSQDKHEDQTRRSKWNKGKILLE